MEVQVAILGGGVTGLWLSYELSRRDITCVVINQERLAAHASTRNQGWIHEGALYAAREQFNTARDCREGYNAILTFADEHNLPIEVPGIDAYYLLRSQEEERRLCERIEAVEDAEIRYSRDATQNLRGSEPYAARGSSPLNHAVEIYDQPINTRVLLQGLAETTVEEGTGFVYTTRPLNDLTIYRQNGQWTLQSDHVTISADVLLACAGALMPEVLQEAGVPDADQYFQRTKIMVGIFHEPVYRSLLVVPPQAYSRQKRDYPPNISPFFDDPRDGVQGFSVCLASHDQDIASAFDLNHEEHYLRTLALRLDRYHPLLSDYVEHFGSIPAHFYYCQKIQPATKSERNRGHFKIDHSVEQFGEIDGLYSLYPGKFTATPVAASEWAEDIMEELDPMPGGGDISADSPEVSQRRYFDPPDLTLETDPSGNLRLN